MVRLFVVVPGIIFCLLLACVLLLIGRVDNEMGCFADPKDGELVLMQIRLEQLGSRILDFDSVEGDAAPVDESSGFAWNAAIAH